MRHDKDFNATAMTRDQLTRGIKRAMKKVRKFGTDGTVTGRIKADMYGHQAKAYQKELKGRTHV